MAVDGFSLVVEEEIARGETGDGNQDRNSVREHLHASAVNLREGRHIAGLAVLVSLEVTHDELVALEAGGIGMRAILKPLTPAGLVTLAGDGRHDFRTTRMPQISTIWMYHSHVPPRTSPWRRNARRRRAFGFGAPQARLRRASPRQNPEKWLFLFKKRGEKYGAKNSVTSITNPWHSIQQSSTVLCFASSSRVIIRRSVVAGMVANQYSSMIPNCKNCNSPFFSLEKTAAGTISSLSRRAIRNLFGRTTKWQKMGKMNGRRLFLPRL